MYSITRFLGAMALALVVLAPAEARVVPTAPSGNARVCKSLEAFIAILKHDGAFVWEPWRTGKAARALRYIRQIDITVQGIAGLEFPSVTVAIVGASAMHPSFAAVGMADGGCMIGTLILTDDISLFKLTAAAEGVLP